MKQMPAAQVAEIAQCVHAGEEVTPQEIFGRANQHCQEMILSVERKLAELSRRDEWWEFVHKFDLYEELARWKEERKWLEGNAVSPIDAVAKEARLRRNRFRQCQCSCGRFGAVSILAGALAGRRTRQLLTSQQEYPAALGCCRRSLPRSAQAPARRGG